MKILIFKLLLDVFVKIEINVKEEILDVFFIFL